MERTLQQADAHPQATMGINTDKAQAAACIAASACISITLIVWAIKSFI